MNIELRHWCQIVVDLTTKLGGTGAINQHVDDSDTEVYYGPLHACVIMKDIELEVIMDPVQGDWADAGWARTRAFQAVCEALSPGDLFMLCNLLQESGQHAGALSAKREIRNALGIKD